MPAILRKIGEWRTSFKSKFRGKKNGKSNQTVVGESSGAGNTEHPTTPQSDDQFHGHSDQSAETSNNTGDATTEGTETNQPSNDHQLIEDEGSVEPPHVAANNMDEEGKNNNINGGLNQVVVGGPSGAVSTDMSPSICTYTSGAENTKHPTPARNGQSHGHPHQSANQQSTEMCNNTEDATTEAADTHHPSDGHQLVDDGTSVEAPGANNRGEENSDVDNPLTAETKRKDDEVQQHDAGSSGYGSSLPQSANIELAHFRSHQEGQSSNNLSEGRSRTSTLDEQEKQGRNAETDETFNNAEASQYSEGSHIQLSSNIDAVGEDKMELINYSFPSFDQGHSENKSPHSYFETQLEGKTYKLRSSSCGDSSEYGDTDGESDSDGGNSSDSELDEELPQDFIDKILSLCNRGAVDYLQLTYLHRILSIYGVGVSSIEQSLKSCVKEIYGDRININICEQDSYDFQIEYAGKFNGEIKVSQYIVEKNKWKYHESATCGIILAGTPKDVSKPEQALYAVIPAHLPISTTDCIEMCKAGSAKKISDIQDSIQMSRVARYDLQVHNRDIKVDLIHHPMAVYQQYFEPTKKTTTKVSHQKFSKDMAIVRLNLADDPCMLQDIRDAMSHKTLSSGHEPKLYKVGEILPLNDPKKLVELLRAEIDIKVGNFDGRSIFTGWSPNLGFEGRQRAFAFTFRTNKHQLVPGNSGTTVYAVDAEEDKLYPLGIVTGEEKVKPLCGSTVYTAALFAPNLQHIEEKYGELYAANLNSISTNDEGALDLQEMLTKLRNTKKLKRKQKSTAGPPADTVRKDKVDAKICNTSKQDHDRHVTAVDSGFLTTSMNSNIDTINQKSSLEQKLT